MGNVTQRQDNNRSLTENLYYDSLYRLSTSSLNGTQNLSVSYDVTGNITSRSDVASGTTWTYDPVRKHAVTKAGSSSFAYAYDANGNMSSRQGATLTWSSYNYPTAISAGSGSTAESISLGYGPDRQRYEQIYGGNGISQTTFYIGGLLELVEDTGVNTYRHYIYAGNQPVAVYSRTTAASNTYNYLLGDHQGSVAAITNSSGALVVAESNTPFGTRRNPTTWSGAASTSDLTTSAAITRQGYTFQTALGLWTGLNHMNGRVQDSVTGRFLSADPGGTDQNNTQSWNRYSYVTNNPLTFTDSTGMQVDSPMPIDPEDLSPSLSMAFNNSWTRTTNSGNDADGTLLYSNSFITSYTSGGGASASPSGSVGGNAGAVGGSGNGAQLGGAGGNGRGIGGGPNGATSPPQQIPCLAGVNCYAPQGNQQHSCPKGTLATVANGLIDAGQKAVTLGGSITLAGGSIIAGGAIASATGVGAVVGVPAMAAGATAAEVGGTTTFVGIGLQGIGGAINAYGGNSQPLTSALLNAGAAGLNSVINHYFPNLTDLLPIDPLGAAADRLAGENTCP
jgi:RHS repeat-associated protein